MMKKVCGTDQMESEDIFGGLFDEDESETIPNRFNTQLGSLPVLPEATRAESGFVGLMNQFVTY